ncbi:MAG: exosortase, partial [Ectothiorhodospiraceae bacterium]|nr:exosortase [Ectothiorhodospiraceae bacterium]
MIASAFLLVIALHAEPVTRLFNRWLRFDEAYSHGLFVLGVTVFLLYRVLRRHQFALQPSVLGVGLAALTAFAITLADVINILILQQLGVVFLVWAIAVALLGWRAGLRLAVPIGFLYYAVPIWDYLTRPLVNAAVVINDFLLGFMGIHFRVDGVYIQLLDVGTFEVADGCSGLRYLVVALTLSTLFSALNFSRAREWIYLHAVAITMALLVNWVRIFVIILAGYHTDMQSSLIEEHELFGWVLFAVALLPFFLFANRLANRSPEPGGHGEPATTQERVKAARAGVVAAVMVVLVATPNLFLTGATAAGSPSMTFSAPDALGGYERRSQDNDGLWNPVMRGPDVVVRETYAPSSGEGAPLHLGIWHYADQRQDRELVQFSNRVVDGNEWRVEQRIRNPGDLGGWSLLVVNHRYLNQRRVVAMSYNVAGRWVDDDIAVKANM